MLLEMINYFVIITNAKALIIPSLYEGFGLNLLEAMRFKCPIFVVRLIYLMKFLMDM